MSVAVIVMTKNEEKNLPRLFDSLAWVDEIIVVDDLSTDRTVAVAQKYGATVIRHKLEDFASQMNVGLAHATRDWVLKMDADEEVPPGAAEGIKNEIAIAPATLSGFRILRKNFVLGRWFKHAQEYGSKVRFFNLKRRRQGLKVGEYVGGDVKLFRRQGSRFENLVHEEVRLPGAVKQTQIAVNHYTAESVQAMFDKVHVYTSLHARQLFEKHPHGLPQNYYWTLVNKPMKTFLTLYLRKLGFLDGFPGFLRCCASAYYEFVKYAKLYDFYRPGLGGGC